ncbi:hypothetical protein F5Y10DRAFT_293678 [Nemania abortiva]|nr:hypothetical protein F5Y10DRAFT_293678 [Nemania abortiva]
MRTQREINEMEPSERRMYEERAARKRARTSWRTDATETEKETALMVALNQIGGRKKYSWLQNGPKTVADTLGQKRAIELGIRTGKLAEELKIGEHRDERGPQSLVVYWEDLRSAGINMSKEEFEKSLRDAGTPEEEIRIALGDKPKKPVGRSAASVKGRSKPSTSEVAPPVIPSVEAATPPPATPAKKRGRKRAAAEDTDKNNKGAAKKRKTNKSTVAKAAGGFATPPKSSSPTASGSSPSNAIVLLDEDDDATPSPTAPELGAAFCGGFELQFPPSSPSEPELEPLFYDENAPHFAASYPTLPELETSLDSRDAPPFTPPSSSIHEPELISDDEDTPQFAPPSPAESVVSEEE